jgi:hypothetical protein
MSLTSYWAVLPATNPRQTVALLVAGALDRQDGVGELARRMRKKFAKKSIPHSDYYKSRGKRRRQG